MLFHNPLFLLAFLPIVFILYFFISKNKKNVRMYLLIFAGIIFYSVWNFKLSPIIVVSILINYYFGKRISDSLSVIIKKKILIISIIFNIIFLAFFKYADFIIFNLNIIFSSNFEFLNFPFPLALSFVTFQTIAYLVDCYDGNVIKHNLRKYSLFIIFFPQLIAGPIVRYNSMISQFEDKKNSSIIYKNICIGLIVIAIGIIKKVLIADNLSILVDQGHNINEQLSFIESWLISTSFTFQLYFDFSGYIDMATGIALLFNINLPQNFDSPFKATNIINFWQRWHITLTNFLTNYIYNPLLRSFRKLTFYKSMLGTFIVFIIAGLWHGPSWLFIIFGGLHGVGIIVNQIFKKFFVFKINKIIAQIFTFLYINFTFIFFRSENIEDALRIINGMFNLSRTAELSFLNLSTNSIYAFVASILVCFVCKNTNFIIIQLRQKNILD